SLDLLMKEKEEITTLVSHNLRTPLNQIRGLCDLMKVDDEHENLLIYADKISKITDAQLHTLSDLLNQLMHQNVNLQVPQHSYNLNDLILKEIGLVEIGLKNKKLELVFETAETPFFTTLNEKKIALIIQNLISNAIKFSFEGNKIFVGIKKEGNKLEIYVKDNGIGFSADYKKHLFHDARETGRRGTKDEPSVGLGLHLCKRIIHQLGGELTAHSDGENKGATFSIII
ncbi:HAMP domain-containing histidine kinase, partial [Pelobium sp.]